MTKSQNLNFDKNSFIRLVKKYGAEESWIKIPENYSIKPLNLFHNAIGVYESVPSKPTTNVNVPLTHNNMIPFFGGNSKQNVDYENRRINNTLDIFTGQFRLDQEHKTEVGTLFAPAPQNLTGVEAPRGGDVMDLYNSSCTIRNGEKPMEQIRVARGLNNGYTDKGSGGFHNTLRIRPFTTDELNVNPKVQFEQRHNAGKDPIDNRPSAPNLIVYGPHTLVENEDGRRNFTTTGEKIAPMVYSDVVLKNTNRKNMKMQVGFSGNTRNDPLPCNRQQKVKKALKFNYNNTPHRNIGTTDANKAPNAKPSYEAVMNHTKRQDTLVNYIMNGIFGELKGSTKNVVRNNQKARMTRNEGTINNNSAGFINTLKKNIVYDPKDVPLETKKQQVENNNRSGVINSDKYVGKTYDPSDAPQTTGRETFEVNKRSNNVYTNTYIGVTYDPNDTPDVTGRETIEVNKHVGNIFGEGLKASKIYDPNDTPDVTGRETIEVNKYIGMNSNNEGTKKHICYDPFDVPLNTIRQTTENNNYIAGVNSNYLQDGAGYMTLPRDIENTQRQTYSKYYYVKTGAEPNVGPRVYDDSYNMRQNGEKEIIAQGRYPTLSNAPLFNGPDTLNISVNKMDNDRKNNYVCTPTLIPGGERKIMNTCEVTKSRNTIGARNPSFDPNILSAFNRNPLTQSLQSWA